MQSTLDTERSDIMLGAIDKGYHILIDKSLRCTPEEVVRIQNVAKSC